MLFVIFFNYLFTTADSIDVTSLISDIDYWFLLLFFPDQPGQSFVNFIDHEKPTFILLIFILKTIDFHLILYYFPAAYLEFHLPLIFWFLRVGTEFTNFRLLLFSL